MLWNRMLIFYILARYYILVYTKICTRRICQFSRKIYGCIQNIAFNFENKILFVLKLCCFWLWQTCPQFPGKLKDQKGFNDSRVEFLGNNWICCSISTRERPLGRPWRRWEDNIRMDLEEIGINAWNWVDSAQDWDYWRALVNAALNLQVP